MAMGNAAMAAFQVFEDVRGAIAMYMFIIEESIQTASMGCYILHGAGRDEDAAALAQWAITELVNPLLQFSTGAVASTAYPLELSYNAFAEASKRTLEVYTTL